MHVLHVLFICSVRPDEPCACYLYLCLCMVHLHGKMRRRLEQSFSIMMLKAVHSEYGRIMGAYLIFNGDTNKCKAEVLNYNHRDNRQSIP